MAEVKGISEIAFRSSIDTIADIIGENGKNSILRYAGLEEYIVNPPAYDIETIVTPNSIVTRFFKALRDIMGDKGYETIMFRAGAGVIKIVVDHVPDFQGLLAMDIDPKEKVKFAYFGYITSTKDDPDTTLELHLDENEVVMHFPECNECWEIVEEAGGGADGLYEAVVQFRPRAGAPGGRGDPRGHVGDQRRGDVPAARGRRVPVSGGLPVEVTETAGRGIHVPVR